MTPGEGASHSQGLPVIAISMPSSPIPAPSTSINFPGGNKEKFRPQSKAKTSPKEPALLLPCRSYWNANQGRQVPESLPQAPGPRLGKEEVNPYPQQSQYGKTVSFQRAWAALPAARVSGLFLFRDWGNLFPLPFRRMPALPEIVLQS